VSQSVIQFVSVNGNWEKIMFNIINQDQFFDEVILLKEFWLTKVKVWKEKEIKKKMGAAILLFLRKWYVSFKSKINFAVYPLYTRNFCSTVKIIFLLMIYE